MNNVFLYQHNDGFQFLSTATPLVLLTWHESNPIYGSPPKLIGVWKFKSFKTQTEKI